MPQVIEAVLFDLDGTLADTAPDLFGQFAHRIETVAQNMPHKAVARADPSPAEERNRS